MCCNKIYQKKFINKNLKEWLLNTYKVSSHDKIKFILLLRKGVYHSEYMNKWKKFNKTSLPEKEDLYSHLNMEDITDADYVHTKKMCKELEIKGEYYDLYVQSNTLLNLEICVLKYTNLILLSFFQIHN